MKIVAFVLLTRRVTHDSVLRGLSAIRKLPAQRSAVSGLAVNRPEPFITWQCAIDHIPASALALRYHAGIEVNHDNPTNSQPYAAGHHHHRALGCPNGGSGNLFASNVCERDPVYEGRRYRQRSCRSEYPKRDVVDELLKSENDLTGTVALTPWCEPLVFRSLCFGMGGAPLGAPIAE